MDCLPLYTLQLNTGQHGNVYRGRDLNVERAWLQGLSGCNVTVVVVDDGMQQCKCACMVQ